MPVCNKYLAFEPDNGGCYNCGWSEEQHLPRECFDNGKMVMKLVDKELTDEEIRDWYELRWLHEKIFQLTELYEDRVYDLVERINERKAR